jgi:hypothetical protein
MEDERIEMDLWLVIMEDDHDDHDEANEADRRDEASVWSISVVIGVLRMGFQCSFVLVLCFCSILLCFLLFCKSGWGINRWGRYLYSCLCYFGRTKVCLYLRLLSYVAGRWCSFGVFLGGDGFVTTMNKKI